MSLIAVAMNILLVGLLLAALGLGWRLDRRLRAVRDGQSAFTRAVAELDTAAGRAQAGLAELRAATDEAIELLGGRIVRAREASERLDQSLARAEAMPRPAPAAAAPVDHFSVKPDGELKGLDALLARIEGAQLARPAARGERRQAETRPGLVDDDLFVDGGRA